MVPFGRPVTVETTSIDAKPVLELDGPIVDMMANAANDGESSKSASGHQSKLAKAATNCLVGFNQIGVFVTIQ